MFKKRGQRDNRGMTLIELVCAAAILAIISATIGGAMVVATNSYRSGTVETALQQEAEFTANTIESLIIDATDKVEFVGSTLTINNVDATYTIAFNSGTGQLTYTDGTSSGLLAEHVADFRVDTSAFDTARTVQVFLDMENGGKKFQTAYNITSRNNPDAGAPVTLTAVISAQNEIILEPGQNNYVLGVNVMGPSNKDIVVAGLTDAVDPDTKAEVVGGGVKFTIGKLETGSPAEGVLHLILQTRAKAADGTPLATKNVTVKIRRVYDLSFSNFTLSGPSLKAGARYTISATPGGKNLSRGPAGVDYDSSPYEYVDPGKVEWSFKAVGGTGNGDDYAQIVELHGSNNTEVVFELKQDIPSGMILQVWATAQHPNGVNKSGQIYGAVADYRALQSANPLRPRDSELRRGDECYVDADLDPARLVEEEWKRNHPGAEMPDSDRYNGGFTGSIYFRYISTDNTHTSPGYPNWIRMAEQGNNPSEFKFNAGDFQDMLFMKDYTLQILYSYKYNTGDNRIVYYPASAYPGGVSQPVPNVDPTYIYELPMHAFSMGFEEYQDGKGNAGSCAPYATADGCGLGTLAHPLPLGFGGQVQLKFNVFTGATAEKGGTLESVLNSAKCYEWNGTVWMPKNLQLRFSDRWDKQYGHILFEPQNGGLQVGKIYKIVLESVQGETYAYEPVPNQGGRGVIYFEMTN